MTKNYNPNIIDSRHPIYELRRLYNKARELSEDAVYDTKSRGFSFLEHEVAFSNLAFELLNADLEISRNKDRTLQRINEKERKMWRGVIDGYLFNIRNWNREAIAYLSFYSRDINYDEFLKKIKRE